MNIRTITYHNSHNYGAMLQAYALMKCLKDRGHDVKIIDYVMQKDTDANRIFAPNTSVKAFIKNLYNLACYKALKSRYKRFEAFKTEYMDLTKQYDERSIKNIQEAAEVFVAGSDQIWNCLNGFIMPFYLDFVKKGKKVAYAASIGISQIPAGRKETFWSLVSSFDAISVREQAANTLLEKEFAIRSQVVCDPVLLLQQEHWNSLSGDTGKNEKYILCYCLGNIEDVNQCLRRLKDKYDLPVYLLSRSGYSKICHDKLICDAGPLEFLTLIKNAELVVCSSFHGTVFSTVFEKNFISVVDTLKPARVTDYLTYLGLEKCLYAPDMDLALKIDYEKVRQKIGDYRRSSIKFIEDNIET